MSHDRPRLRRALTHVHRPDRRPVLAVLGTLLVLLATLLALGSVSPVAPAGATGSSGTSGAAPQGAAVRVPTQQCRAVDPNLVRGTCLRYTSAGRSWFTWIGSYRAPSGRVFFCIDYLYDSRLPAHARLRTTHGLVNQLGHAVGAPEVAALNALVSRWAAHGSTGSAERDAAVALVVREVMGDGRRSDGTVVYPAGLHVGGVVRAPRGGVPAAVLADARAMWSTASSERGPYVVRLTSREHGRLQLGHARHYDLTLRSAAGRPVPGVRVGLTCSGPISCPRSVLTTTGPSSVVVRPHDTGRFRLTADVDAPAPDGQLYVARGWHTHGGASARDAGVQRGWIAQRRTVRTSVGARSFIVRARPHVTTTASDQVALPGAALHDSVVVAGLADTYDRDVVASLYGPYDAAPGAGDCDAVDRVGRVRVRVDHDGTYTTPDVTVGAVGHYVWAEQLVGDRYTRGTTTPCGVAVETTLVRRLPTALTTGVSSTLVGVDHVVHDVLHVSGTAEETVAVHWWLRGPVPARHGGCRDLGDSVWGSAPVRAHGSVSVVGAGQAVTPGTALRTAGCYSYGESIPRTLTTEATRSAPGQPVETTLVVRRPVRVRTAVSHQEGGTGAPVHDVVVVHGLRGHDRVSVHWRLLGPVAPRGGSCRGLAWPTGTPVADHGVVEAGPRHPRVRTASTRLPAPGCYTYTERLPATPSTRSATSVPGLRVETTLVVRPALERAPFVPSGVGDSRSGPDLAGGFYRAPTRLDHPDAGGRLRVPGVGIDAHVDAVGLDGSTVAIPGDIHRVGWLDRSAAAGDVVGASVIVGHVSDRHDRPGALWRLRGVHVGALVVWVDATGATHRFRVSHLARYPRTHRLPRSVFGTGGPHVLRLVTCTDRHSHGGHFHYADNLVVTARPVR